MNYNRLKASAAQYISIQSNIYQSDIMVSLSFASFLHQVCSIIQWIVKSYLQGGGQELLQLSSLFLYIFCSLLRQLTTKIKNKRMKHCEIKRDILNDHNSSIRFNRKYVQLIYIHYNEERKYFFLVMQQKLKSVKYHKIHWVSNSVMFIEYLNKSCN